MSQIRLTASRGSRQLAREGSKMDRRSFVIGTVASAATLAAGPVDRAGCLSDASHHDDQSVSTGGVSDTITRPLDAALEAVFKQPVVLENKAGAAGAVGAQYVAAAKPDGYTLLTTSCRFPVSQPSTSCSIDSRNLPMPISFRLARIIADPIVLIVSKDAPYKTLKDLVADAKANPNKVIYSSSGLYGASHIPTVLFAKVGRQSGDAPSADQRRRTRCHRRAGRQCQLLHVADLDRLDAYSRRKSTAACRIERKTYVSRCLTSRPSRSLATISSTISGSEFSPRRERRRRSSTPCARDSTRPHTASNSLDTLENLGQELATWISRNLLTSGLSTPNARKMP